MPIKSKDPGEITIGKSTPAWMLSYADMMTQILIFFILLFSLSDINLLKFSAFFKKMKRPPVVLDEEQLRRVMLEIGEYAEKKGLQDALDMEINERGLSISLTEKYMFNSGSADLLPQSLPILNEIVDKLKNVSNGINIEGHTDNMPISNDMFSSNWELSTTRATNMVKYLVEQKGIDPARISASGYAEYKPAADNSTPAGRSKNRRVVLIVQRQKVTLLP
jgi:chemotaxis protein MotB